MREENQIILKLLKLGFYPNDLPPEFKVSGVCDSFINEFIKNIDIYDSLKNGRKTSEPIQLTVPKNKESRRWFHILNPLHFIRLADTIVQNEEKISEFCDKSKFSVSKIKFSNESDLVFEKGPFRESVRERVSRSAGKKYLLTMDITSFYPSIYTHTLEWIFEGRRLIGKERKDRNFIGVALDQDIRASQSGKTNGISIGPETSRIISEIVGVYLDEKISKLGIRFKGTRYVDDYHLYFNNLSDLELVKLTLQSELNLLNLSSNEAKCEVKNVPEIFEQNWVQELSNLNFRKTKIGFQKDLISAFSLAFNNSQTHSKDFSLKFLISMMTIKEFSVCNESKELLLELLRHSVELDSRTMSRAFKLIHKLDAFGDSDKFQELFNEKLLTDSRLGKTYEVLWLLSCYNHLKIEVPNEIIDNSINQCEILTLTYLLFMSERKLIDTICFDKIHYFIQESVKEMAEPLMSKYWIILYEGSRRKWWENFVEFPSYFDLMFDYSIGFLDDFKFDWSRITISTYPYEELVVEDDKSE